MEDFASEKSPELGRQSHDTLVEENNTTTPSMAHKLTTIHSINTNQQAPLNEEQQPWSASTAPGDSQKDIERDIEKAQTNAGNPSMPPPEPTDPTIVTWSGPDDPENPMNWSRKRRWLYTGLLASLTWLVTFASSVFSTGTRPVMAEFGVGQEVATLGTALFVLGFGLAPVIWGPLSELYGRMPPLFFSFAVFAIFQIPVAVAQNIETILVCRFVGGFFGVGPLAIIGGTLGDIWPALDRGIAMAVFGAATFIGPIAGPVMGGFITQSHLGWRWTAWITLIMASASGLLAASIIPETYGPVILKRRAQRLRHETKNWALHAKSEESSTTLNDILQKYINRPAQMLVAEPMLFLVTIYMALIYGILYLFFEAYPISFQEERGWNDGVGALPFLSIFIGVLAGSLLVVVSTKTRYARLYVQTGGRVPPEERLILMAVGGCFLPAGLFWFGWTSSPHITWVPQVLAGAPIGFGIFLIFLQGLNYIVDVYLMYANSALAGNIFLRSLFGAGFPLFATQMYHKLGVAWASSLLGFLCAAAIPIPFLFIKYGAGIRAKARFTPKL